MVEIIERIYKREIQKNENISKISRERRIISCIGLGYVGLPIALEFAKKIKVVGFDINLKG